MSTDFAPPGIIDPAEFANDWQVNIVQKATPAGPAFLFVPANPRRIALIIGSNNQSAFRLGFYDFTNDQNYINLTTSTGVLPFTLTYSQHGGLVQTDIWAAPNSSISIKLTYIETLWIPKS